MNIAQSMFMKVFNAPNTKAPMNSNPNRNAKSIMVAQTRSITPAGV